MKFSPAWFGAIALALVASTPSWLSAQAIYDPYVVSTFAGSHGGAGFVDGIGPGTSLFNFPQGIDLDASGNMYVADTNNHVIRKITPDGMVTTLAGLEGAAGSNDGTGSAARFRSPRRVAADIAGNVYVSDTGNHTIRKVTASGIVTTVAGLAGISGAVDGTGSNARFFSPSCLVVDSDGTIYVGDSSNYTIRKIAPGGVVTTLAGMARVSGTADGTGSAARFSTPDGITQDSAGNLYVADSSNFTIRKVTLAAVVTTIAGSAGNSGTADGTGSAARFYFPFGVKADTQGNIWVCDFGNHTIRKITPQAVVTTFAGLAGTPYYADGIGSAARFNGPEDVTIDYQGSLLVVDGNNHTIRKVTPNAQVSRVAGYPGIFYQPEGLARDGADNTFVADTFNHTIRKITVEGLVSTFAGLAGNSGNADGIGNAARFNFPSGLALDSDGNLYVSDSSNHTIRKVTPQGAVTTVAGTPGQHGTADGAGSAARFNHPANLAMDSAGNIYVLDISNFTIRKVTPGALVTTLAGRPGIPGFADGLGSAAQFSNFLGGIAVGPADNIYVTDNCTLRRITPNGQVTTFLGVPGYSDHIDGPGNVVRFGVVRGLHVDRDGNILVADTGTIRRVTPELVVRTLAGIPGSSPSLGVDGVGSAARFNIPANLMMTNDGRLFISDALDQTIRIAVPVLSLVNAASRKQHGSIGTFDINLPMTGQAGVECRSGGANGDYEIVVTFNNPIVTASAALTTGTGTITGGPTISERTVAIQLTGVTDIQRLGVTLSKISDAFNQVLPDQTVNMNILIGDVNGNKAVNSSDVTQVKAQSGAPVTSANFRSDINVSGNVNASDVGLAKVNSGHGIQ